MIVNSEESAKECRILITEEFKKHKYLAVKIQKATRLQIQNRWVNLFYSMVSRQQGNPRETLENECKYSYGLPIMLRDDPEMASLWRKILSGLDHDERRLAMKGVKMTSDFDVAECGEYIEQLICNFNDFELPRPDWRNK